MEARRRPLRTDRGQQGIELGQAGDRQVQVSGQGGAQGRVLRGRPSRIHHGQEPGENPGRPAGGLPRGAGNAGLIQEGSQGQGLGELGHPQPGGPRRQGCQGDGSQAMAIGIGLDHGHPRHAGRLRQKTAVVGDRSQIDDGAGCGRAGQRAPGR